MEREAVEALSSQIVGIVQIQHVLIHALHRSGDLDKDEVAEALKHVAAVLENEVNSHAAHPVDLLARMLCGEVPLPDGEGRYADWPGSRKFPE